MSRSHNSTRRYFRNVKNSFIKMKLNCCSEEIYPKNGKNVQGKLIRARLRQKLNREVDNYERQEW